MEANGANYYLLAIALQRKGNIAEAKEAVQKAIRFRPQEARFQKLLKKLQQLNTSPETP